MSLCLQCIALNEEEKLCFRDSERTKEYGWIGYLRGDFGRSGEEFHSTWFEGDNPELNNEQFKECHQYSEAGRRPVLGHGRHVGSVLRQPRMRDQHGYRA